MPEHHAPVAAAEGAHRLHVLELPHHEHLAAYQSRHPGPPHEADREEHHAQGGLERGHERDEQEEGGKGERHVGKAHHEVVHPAAVEAGHEAERHAEHERDRLRDQPDREGDARAVDEPRPHVAPLHVRPEPVLRGRPLELAEQVDLHGVVTGDGRGGGSREHEEHHHGEAEARAAVACKAAPNGAVHPEEGSRSSGGVSAGWRFQRRWCQKYCSGARRTCRSSCAV